MVHMNSPGKPSVAFAAGGAGGPTVLGPDGRPVPVVIGPDGNFTGLVLGCIEAQFCKKICV